MSRIAKKAVADKVEVGFTLTGEQYAEMKKLCAALRLELNELAKSVTLQALVDRGYDKSFVNWHIDMANADRDTGRHPAFEHWKEIQREQAEEGRKTVAAKEAAQGGCRQPR